MKRRLRSAMRECAAQGRASCRQRTATPRGHGISWECQEYSRRPGDTSHCLLEFGCIVLVFAILVVGVGSLGAAASRIDVLRQGFLHPPDSARPWVYWFWMDGNIT